MIGDDCLQAGKVETMTEAAKDQLEIRLFILRPLEMRPRRTLILDDSLAQ